MIRRPWPSGDCTRLERCGAWLTALTLVPTDDLGWHRLGTHATGWLIPLPVGWESNWSMLSPREMTLTVEALDDLDTQRPGAIAAALSPTDPEPSPPVPLFQDVPVNWCVSDALACVEREMARCEAESFGAVRQGRLTADYARQEVSQMKATAIIRRAVQEKDLDVRQETLF